MTTKTRRLSDQTLVMQAIGIVREELALASDPRDIEDCMTRLCSLYACIDVSKVADILKQHDGRGNHGKA